MRSPLNKNVEFAGIITSRPHKQTRRANTLEIVNGAMKGALQEVSCRTVLHWPQLEKETSFSCKKNRQNFCGEVS